MTFAQIDFTGGMSVLLDSTKTMPNQYRLGINTRITENGFEGAYEPILYPGPNSTYQTIFTVDDNLILVAGGQMHKLNFDIGSFEPLWTPLGLSTTAQIYHESVPAPSNSIVNGTYRSTVATFRSATILQDGVNRPVLLYSDFATRYAQDYAGWTYDNPEYVPVGKLMASSGNKTFIVSADGRRIYQSVSGRQLDFVLNFNSTTGVKQGDADSTYLAVSAAEATAVIPAQDGGLLVSTRYKTYGLMPVPEVDTIFGEPYYQPRDIFPVGAVGPYAFGAVNGETIFVSPVGIQIFNQVMQTQRASNNSPFGAPIAKYIRKPIRSTAVISVSDFTFIALSTIFGDGIAVYDTKFGAFCGFDLVGTVKEFAVVERDGMPRLFYMTANNRVYELPLFSGTRRKFTVYLGEYCSQQGHITLRAQDAILQFTDVQAGGDVVVESYMDKVLQKRTVKALSGTRLSPVYPVAIPNGTDGPMQGLSYDIGGDKTGYALGIAVTCAADARLVSAVISADEATRSVVGPRVSESPVENFSVFGNIAATTEVLSTGSMNVTRGRRYVAWNALGALDVVNGSETLSRPLDNQPIVFRAKAERIIMTGGAMLQAFDVLETILERSAGSTRLVTLGDHENNFYPESTIAILDLARLPRISIIGASDARSTADRFYAKLGIPRYYTEVTEFAVFVMISTSLTITNATVDANGVCAAMPADMLIDGPMHEYAKMQFAAYPNKLHVLAIHFPPYSTGLSAPGFSQLRWPNTGAHIVVSGFDKQYERTTVDGIHYVNVGTAGPVVAGQPGHLHIAAAAQITQAQFINYDGSVADKFTVLV